jgi:hypothetical protein
MVFSGKINQYREKVIFKYCLVYFSIKTIFDGNLFT